LDNLEKKQGEWIKYNKDSMYTEQLKNTTLWACSVSRELTNGQNEVIPVSAGEDSHKGKHQIFSALVLFGWLVGWFWFGCFETGSHYAAGWPQTYRLPASGSQGLDDRCALIIFI
jgi:hypothetical protein